MSAKLKSIPKALQIATRRERSRGAECTNQYTSTETRSQRRRNLKGEGYIIYPGTFDPITNGHVDLITRASKIFDKVVVAVAEHTSKKTLLSYKDRIAITKKSIIKIPNTIVLGFQNLLVDFANDQNIFLILRGIRAIADFEYERQLSSMNHHLSPNMETVFMAPQEKYAHISSTFVRDIARLGGDISAFVPKIVAEKLQRK